MIAPRVMSTKIIRSLRYRLGFQRDLARARWAAATFRARLRIARVRGRRPLVLVARPGAIGDIVCTFPLLEALRRDHPKAHIVYGALRAFTPVAAMSRCVDAVVEVDADHRAPKIHEADYDLVLRPTYGSDATDGQDRVHMVDDYCARAGLTPPERQPRLAVDPRTRARVRGQLADVRGGAPAGPVIAIHVGPSWPVRTWPPDRWAALVENLRRTAQAVVIQLGDDFHLETGASATPRVPGTVDWVGRHTLAETAAVLQLCDLFIGIDSGLLHMAGAVGTPCVGLFGATQAEYRMPPETPSIGVQGNVACAGCHHRQPRLHWKTGCPHDIACMQSIDVKTVRETCAALLAPAVSGSQTARP